MERYRLSAALIYSKKELLRFKLCSSVPLLVLQFNCEMCMGHKWVICAASCLGLIQSIVWTGLSIAGALLYLNAITVEPYKESGDFFKVTVAKLYFEGPNSKINGSYLGKFEEDYRNPNVIDLFWPDKMFAVSVAYVIINVSYFFLSILLYYNRSSKKPNESRRFLDIALGWSCITFLLCAIDVMLMYFLFRDFLQIKDYVSDKTKNAPASYWEQDLMYVPLILAFASGRIIILWVWNFVIACLLFFNALCCRKVLKESLQSEQEDKQEQKVIVPPKLPQVLPPVKLINKSYGTSYDTSKDSNSVDVKRSMEAVTSFSCLYGDSQALQAYSPHDWNLAPSESSFQSATWHSKRDVKVWDAINEAFESDEVGSLVLEQTANANQDEIPEQKKIKIVKPPIGKPAEEAGNLRSSEAGSSK